MKEISSEDWRLTLSSNSLGTRFFGLLALALGVMMVIAAGGMVLTDWRDWPVAAFSVVLGGLFGAEGVHLLRRAGKPVIEFDPTGLTYHPLDDISWKTKRIPWERVRIVRWGVLTNRGKRYVYFDYERATVRSWFTRAYDFVPRDAPSRPGRVSLPLSHSSTPEDDELFELLEDLSKRHGFALELG
jgi:hypothetical protein